MKKWVKLSHSKYRIDMPKTNITLEYEIELAKRYKLRIKNNDSKSKIGLVIGFDKILNEIVAIKLVRKRQNIVY